MQKANLTSITNDNYFPDVLGDRFNKLTLSLADDYEGEVVSTLIRRNSESSTNKAILYVHGFHDYFFQEEMAKEFNQQGYNFYALDLRKYGRSYLSHQKMYNVRSLLEYDEEINIALQIIKSENNDHVLLKGHSTGGLIVTNYAGNHLNSTLFHGVICNSPFYEFNLNIIERKIGIPILSTLGKHLPNKVIAVNKSNQYGQSLHKDHHGEWDFSMEWKPLEPPKVNLGFIRAIHKAQERIKHNLIIDVPTLVMYSSKSIHEHFWSDKPIEGDAVLNVDHIRNYAQNIKGNVTSCQIENGMHDLILSKKPVRKKVYATVFEWINNTFK